MAVLQPLVVQVRQVLDVLGVLAQSAGLMEHLEAWRPLFLEDAVEPVILVAGVGVHDDAGLRGSPVTLGGIPPDTALQHVEHWLRYLAHLVEPRPAELQREQLLDVLQVVESAEENLDVHRGAHHVQRHVHFVPSADVAGRHPVVPGVERRVLELAVGVAHHAATTADDTIGAWLLLTHQAHELHHARHALATAEWTDERTHEGVRVVEPFARRRRVVDHVELARCFSCQRHCRSSASVPGSCTG